MLLAKIRQPTETLLSGQEQGGELAADAKGEFYLILRNYALEPSVREALKDRATFEGPPGVMPVK